MINIQLPLFVLLPLFPLHHPIPAVSLSALSITLVFLSLSWLHAVLVIKDCLMCFPSPLSYESCNFVTLTQSSASRHGIAPPTMDFISFYISRKCREKHIFLTNSHMVRCSWFGAAPSLSSLAHGHFFFEWSRNET